MSPIAFFSLLALSVPLVLTGAISLGIEIMERRRLARSGTLLRPTIFRPRIIQGGKQAG